MEILSGVFTASEIHNMALEKALGWPLDSIVPVLDVFRLAILDSSINEHFCSIQVSYAERSEMSSFRAVAVVSILWHEWLTSLSLNQPLLYEFWFVDYSSMLLSTSLVATCCLSICHSFLNSLQNKSSSPIPSPHFNWLLQAVLPTLRWFCCTKLRRESVLNWVHVRMCCDRSSSSLKTSNHLEVFPNHRFNVFFR